MLLACGQQSRTQNFAARSGIITGQHVIIILQSQCRDILASPLVSQLGRLGTSLVEALLMVYSGQAKQMLQGCTKFEISSINIVYLL